MPFRPYPCLRLLALPLLLLALACAQTIAGGTAEDDLDRDGLADSLEQSLLERFAPRFYVSESDCDVASSRFAPGSPDPVFLERDGAIYGQAFRLPPAPNGAARIELHFFHLWTKDCGRFSHEFDAEHVSVLVEAPDAGTSASAWKARYWYAAAHEDTVCDVSHGAHAKALKAETSGTEVWISSGKHASYLAQKRCKLGCGGDQCKRMRPMKTSEILNIGERDFPLNGSLWIASPKWSLLSKMGSDFDQAALAQLERANPKKIVAVNQGVPPVRATILAGGETLDGVATGNRHTGNALKTGKEATGSALGRAFRAVGGLLNGGKAQDPSVAEPGAENAAAPVPQP